MNHADIAERLCPLRTCDDRMASRYRTCELDERRSQSAASHASERASRRECVRDGRSAMIVSERAGQALVPERGIR
jgi:hypothetical protein